MRPVEFVSGSSDFKSKYSLRKYLLIVSKKIPLSKRNSSEFHQLNLKNIVVYYSVVYISK